MQDIEQRCIRVTTVHDALLGLVVEGDLNEMVITVLLDLDTGCGTHNAAVENLKEFRSRQQRFALLGTSGILENVGNAGIRGQRQIWWKILGAHYYNQLAA